MIFPDSEANSIGIWDTRERLVKKLSGLNAGKDSGSFYWDGTNSRGGQAHCGACISLEPGPAPKVPSWLCTKNLRNRFDDHIQLRVEGKYIMAASRYITSLLMETLLTHTFPYTI